MTFYSVTILALCLMSTQAQLDGGLSPHFLSWLDSNGYSSYNFNRSEFAGGSYGGKSSDSDTGSGRKPVLFIHGWSDVGVGSSYPGQSGFAFTIDYFLWQGYTQADIYTTTWGVGWGDNALCNFSSSFLEYNRAFAEAVLAYTGAPKIDVIGHSMGVSIGRSIIKGGQV